MRRFFAKLTSLFPKQQQNASSPPQLGQAFFTFQSTGDVIRAENCLRAAGYAVTVMAPPAWLRTGCDMVLVCDGVQEPAIRRCLTDAKVPPEDVYPVSDDMLQPVSLVNITRFGEDWFMVRAANMKITVALRDGTIVNISGGGCPDVPYLASRLLGQTIMQCEEPRIHGQTLCSYALQKAFEEARTYWLQHSRG